MSDTTLDRYVWLDLETTSADYGTCAVLEAAWYVSDMDLRDVGHRLEQRLCSITGPHGPELPYAWEDLMAGASDVVVEMHQTSGLADAWNATRDAQIVTAGDVLARDLLADLDAHVPDGGRVFLAGDGVGHFDRLVLDGCCPKFTERLHYRPQGDVSPTVRMLSRGQWGPAEFLLNNEPRVHDVLGSHKLPGPLTDTAHRAAFDVVRAVTTARVLLNGGVITWPR